jgi:flavodoxin
MKVAPVNVLVIFQSNCGNTEKLALAAAVGAVQARASIRLRRLPDSGADLPECKEALVRMRKEYVPPTATDTAWADLVIVGMNGKIAGSVTDPAAATTYGRDAVTAVRKSKS